LKKPPGFQDALNKRSAPPSPPDGSQKPTAKRVPSPVKLVKLVPSLNLDGPLTPPVTPDRIVDIQQVRDLYMVSSLADYYQLGNQNINLYLDPDHRIKKYQHAFRGPLVFTSNSDILPVLERNDHSTQVGQDIDLYVTDHRGTGRVWEAFSAVDSHGAKVVVKICDLSRFVNDNTSHLMTRLEARQAIANEARILQVQDKLRQNPLQGDVTPVCYGLWGSVQEDGSEIWVCVTEDGGYAIGKDMLADVRIWQVHFFSGW